MVVAVALYRFNKTLSIEAKLVLELGDNLHVDVVEIPGCPEALSLGLMQLVPGVLTNLFDVDPLVGVCDENFG